MGQNKIAFAIFEAKYAEFNQNQAILSSLKLTEESRKFIPSFVGSCEGPILVTLLSTSLTVFCWNRVAHQIRIQRRLYKWN
jgi:hypothetical protein